MKTKIIEVIINSIEEKEALDRYCKLMVKTKDEYYINDKGEKRNADEFERNIDQLKADKKHTDAWKYQLNWHFEREYCIEPHPRYGTDNSENHFSLRDITHSLVKMIDDSHAEVKILSSKYLEEPDENLQLRILLFPLTLLKRNELPIVFYTYIEKKI